MPELQKLSVFLCHAYQDKTLIYELYRRLSAEGWIDPWLDKEKLKPGDRWEDTIEDAIDHADSVIVFLSQNSVNKEGFVQREMQRAWERSLEKPENVIFLIPIRLDECQAPHRIKKIHWADYFGEEKETTYQNLLHSLKMRYKQKFHREAKAQTNLKQPLPSHPTSPVINYQNTARHSLLIINGGIVHYEAFGRGRPVIFLHSWIGSWRYWFPSMQHISNGFRAYALDLWGFGDTAHDRERYSIDSQVDLLTNFLNEMGIGRVAIIGHGLGGVIGMRFTSRNPQMVDRIMVVSAPMDLNLVNTKLRTGTPLELADWLLHKDINVDSTWVDIETVDPQAISTSFANPEAFGIRWPSNPCLLVYGKNDPAIMIPPIFPEDFPYNTHMIALEFARHFPMLENKPLFNQLLEKFLTLDSGETPREITLK